MSLVVMTAAYYSDPTPLRHLSESCYRLGLPFIAWGLGQPFPGYVEAKLTNMINHEHLASGYDLILFTDAQDSFVLEPAAEILSRFAIMASPIVVACENTCYPDSDLARGFLPGSPYPNAGGFIGYRDSLFPFMRLLLSHYGNLGRCDQIYWVRAMVDSLPGLKMDTGRSIFQCFSDHPDPAQVHTCVHHYNGRTGGIREAFHRRFGTCPA